MWTAKIATKIADGTYRVGPTIEAHDSKWSIVLQKEGDRFGSVVVGSSPGTPTAAPWVAFRPPKPSDPVVALELCEGGSAPWVSKLVTVTEMAVSGEFALDLTFETPPPKSRYSYCGSETAVETFSIRYGSGAVAMGVARRAGVLPPGGEVSDRVLAGAPRATKSPSLRLGAPSPMPCGRSC